MKEVFFWAPFTYELKVGSKSIYHALPSALPPIDTRGKLSAHIFAKSHLNQPQRSHTQGFGTLGQLLNFLPFVRPNIA
jgi:hypothetical protein